MKILTAIFLICGGALTTLAEAGSPAAAANAVVISTGLSNRLVAGARTNEPALAPDRDHFSGVISSEPRNP